MAQAMQAQLTQRMASMGMPAVPPGKAPPPPVPSCPPPLSPIPIARHNQGPQRRDSSERVGLNKSSENTRGSPPASSILRNSSNSPGLAVHAAAVANSKRMSGLQRSISELPQVGSTDTGPSSAVGTQGSGPILPSHQQRPGPRPQAPPIRRVGTTAPATSSPIRGMVSRLH